MHVARLISTSVIVSASTWRMNGCAGVAGRWCALVQVQVVRKRVVCNEAGGASGHPAPVGGRGGARAVLWAWCSCSLLARSCCLKHV